MTGIQGPGAAGVRLSSLFAAFLVIGMAAFGGLGATVRLIQRDLVEKRGWFAARDLAQAMAFTKPLPGSTSVQVVAFLAWRLRKGPGVVTAVTAFLLPALTMMTAAGAGFAALPDAPWVRGAVNGVMIAVVGLLAAAILRLARSEAATPLLLAVLLAAMVAGFFVHAAAVVVAAGLFGVVWVRAGARLRSRKAK